jgi:hypothetical protein
VSVLGLLYVSFAIDRASGAVTPPLPFRLATSICCPVSNSQAGSMQRPVLGTNLIGDPYWQSVHGMSVCSDIMDKCQTLLSGKMIAIAPPLYRFNSFAEDTLFDILQVSMVQLKLKAPGMRIFERSALKDVISSLKFQTSDLFDGEVVKRLGKLASTDYLILLTIRKVGRNGSKAIGVDWRFVSGASGEILEAGAVEFPTKQSYL